MDFSVKIPRKRGTQYYTRSIAFFVKNNIFSHLNQDFDLEDDLEYLMFFRNGLISQNHMQMLYYTCS